LFSFLTNLLATQNKSDDDVEGGDEGLIGDEEFSMKISQLTSIFYFSSSSSPMLIRFLNMFLGMV